MASELLKIGAYEAKNHLELSLRQAFEELEPKLRPPFPMDIPSPQVYLHLNRAILYGVLTDSRLAETHIKYLHAIVTDGYAFFVSLVVKLVNDFYARLVDSVRDQLIWVVKEMVGVLGEGFDGLLVSLLRQIIGGDFSDGNLRLCFELVSLFLSNWHCLLEEEPPVLTSALYVYLRLLADHCKMSNPKLDSLKQLEIEFCVKMLREQFQLCMKIGRDLIRLLQDLVHVPAFRAIWKDLVLNPGDFKTPGFSDVSQLYSCRTSSRYFLLRITPEMETQLRFLLTHVKFGSQKRHQLWFAKKFLLAPERETLIVDIVRFVCCAHHPTNEIIQSDVIPRWAVIGWLLKTCRKNYVQANVKLALFYDWLFFDERTDNIMNIEPGMLLMICSIPKYINMTHSLLEFLLLLGENYDVDRSHVILRGLTSAFNSLVQKGVVHSLDVLTSCDAISPFLKERLGRFLSSPKFSVINESQSVLLPHISIPPLSLGNTSHVETPAPSLEQPPRGKLEVSLGTESVDSPVTVSNGAITTCPSLNTNESQVDAIESLLQNMDNAIKKSDTLYLQILETILLLFVNHDDQAPALVSFSPEILCSRIADLFNSISCELFAFPDCCPSAPSFQIRSPTSLITRTFIFSQHERIQEMLLFWSRNGFPVGAYLLYYASQLAYEAYTAGYSGDSIAVNNSAKLSDSGMSLLIFHVNGYISFLNDRVEHSIEEIISTSEMDKRFITKLVENAFTAYQCFLDCSRTILHKDATSLSKLLSCDLISCLQQTSEKAKFLFCCVFHHFADLCIGQEDIIRPLVSQLDHADIVNLQFEIGLKKFSLFGESTEVILLLIRNSLSWDSLEQHKFCALMRSELVVSNVQVEKIILQFLCYDDLNTNVSAIAAGGLLTLCGSCAPTPDLVGAIILLPNNVFQDFAATALATWVMSSPSMLFESLAKFAEQLNNKNNDAVESAGVTINRSAVLWLLNYFTAKGMDALDIFK